MHLLELSRAGLATKCDDQLIMLLSVLLLSAVEHLHCTANALHTSGPIDHLRCMQLGRVGAALACML